MHRKPQNYKEWRALLHHTWMHIGQHFSIFATMSPSDVHRKPEITRELWVLIRRSRRIELQLSAEFEARTASAMEALWEMVTKEQKKRGEK